MAGNRRRLILADGDYVDGVALMDVNGNEIGTAANPLATGSGVPAAANILTGSATADRATIITVPRGRTWVGSVSLSAGVVVPATQALRTATPSITVLGAGATPRLVAKMGVAAAGGLAASVTGNQGNNAITVPNVVVTALAGADARLILNTSGASIAVASAVGQLL